MQRFPLLLGIAMLALAGSRHDARAECQCVCANEQAVGVCSQPYERPPVCQRLCTRSLSQTLPTPSLNGPIAPGNVYGSPDLSAAARRLGLDAGRGPTSSVLPP